MDKLQPVIRHHFWILFGIALCVLTCRPVRIGELLLMFPMFPRPMQPA